MEVGDIRKAFEIGRGKTNKNQKYIWSACQECGRQRWTTMRRGQTKHPRCNVCAAKEKQVLRHPPNWTPGTVYQSGYVSIRLEKGDFFYPMARRIGYVFEHRLVMAKHLGRNLHAWEIVHHKNHVKDDNRIENLQLVSNDGHNQITILEKRLSYLERRVTLLEAENVLLREGKDALLPRG